MCFLRSCFAHCISAAQTRNMHLIQVQSLLVFLDCLNGSWKPVAIKHFLNTDHLDRKHSVQLTTESTKPLIAAQQPMSLPPPQVISLQWVQKTWDHMSQGRHHQLLHIDLSRSTCVRIQFCITLFTLKNLCIKQIFMLNMPNSMQHTLLRS